MKHTKYLLPSIIIAAGCLLYSYADNSDMMKKMKPENRPTTEARVYPTPAVTQRLAAAEDGAPYGLHVVDIYNKDVTLRWNNPEATNGYFEDFEAHPDFAINSPGNIGWSFLDMDNEETYTWTATSFPTQGQKMAYVIMNPATTTPSVADWPAIQPYSGTKMLVAFTVDGGNNDFIISPELNFEENFQVSFRAKSYTDAYGLERFRVGYSTTGKQASNFTYVNPGEYVEVPAEWTLFKYDIPKEAKYVTINCVSFEAFMLLIDDVFVGTNRVRPKAPAQNYLKGFNLYRNDVKVNDALIEDVSYTDVVEEYGFYNYTISAVYSDGSEKVQKEALTVEVPDIRLLPFEDGFDKNVLEPDNWSAPADEQGNPSKWSSSYHPYGLVDYSAQYVYSSLENYSQSLISKELRTVNRENTYLRFNLRHVNYNNEVGDTLALEISCDNEQTWQRIDAFANDNGTHEWIVKQYNLNEYLTNDLFRIRYRAFGEDAYYIDYWYVDDVKVWCPEWTSAQLTVMCMGEPMANCYVTLTADHDAFIEATTDRNGVIELPKLEKGQYTIDIRQKGYNTYSSTWDIYQDADNRFTADVTKPVLNIDKTSIHTSIASESSATQSITLTNNGNGEMKWNLIPQIPAGSGSDKDAWTIQNVFDTSGDLQTSIAFDGEFFYTTSTFYLGRFFKYDRDGNFIEEFTIPGMYYMLYDFAFDGTYFYGSDYSNHLFCLDLRNKQLIKETVVESEPDLKITHCSYDPRNDQFWVGSFNSVGRIDRDGNVTVSFRPIDNTLDMGAFGSAFDNVTPGGPYLWFSNEAVAGTNLIDQLQILQYNLNTRAVTPISHFIDDVPGYQIGTLDVPNYICGVEATTNYIDGTLSLVGVLKQSPSRIFIYELAKTNDWLSINPEAGTLKSGESQTITFDINSRNGVVGESYSVPIQIYTVPELNPANITVGYTVSEATATPRPTNLTATADGNASVALAWQVGNAKPTGYNLYRNGEKVNSELITTTSYTDTQLVYGNYTYTVAAVYGEKESLESDPASIYMKIGAPYYEPQNLTINVTNNRDVSLNWLQPDAMLQDSCAIRWDSGINSSSMGMAEGGYFWAGVEWNHVDLIEYRNMIISSVDIFIQERFLSLSLQIYKDNKRVVSQNVPTANIKYGEYNNIELKEPISIEPGSDYRVAFLVAHDAGVNPIGIDASESRGKKGNIISEDGKTWYPLTHIGMEGNFNLAINLAPSAATEEQPIGYNVYRNGAKCNTALVDQLSYNDQLSEAGSYNYQVSSIYAGGGESNLSEVAVAHIMELGDPVPPMNVVAQTELNRTIHVRWDFPIKDESSFPIDLAQAQATAEEGYPEYVSMFRGNLAGEIGIASDGEYIYTTLHNTNGTICKYSLDGEYIESILINRNMQGIRNLVYDGSHFFAADANSFLYQIDIENKCITDTFSISEIARHVAYIPELDNGKGGFEVGDWETSIFVSKRGAKLSDGPTLKGAAGSAYHNGTLYTFEQGYEHPYTICCYNIATGALAKTINIGDYVEITPEAGAKAGGMSIIYTKEGLTLLAVALQENSNCRFIFFDLGSINGLAGYNVYRNGVKRNNEPIPFRYFTEDESEVGTYEYEIETVYIDGAVSPRSHKAYVDIYDAENCDAPIDVKAVQSTYGYNVNISFVDPTATEAELYESIEEGIVGTAFARADWSNYNGAWQVTGATAYHGTKALQAAKADNAWLIIPAGKPAQDMVFSLVARNHDDHLGSGSLRVLTSVDGNNIDDFIPFKSITTTEAWKQYSFTIPAGSDYIAIRHEAGAHMQYIDAITLDTHTIGEAYGYDIMRNGVQLNDQPITDITYTDRNLIPGTYSYQVRAHYLSSCVSEYTEAVNIDLEYSNGCQKPGMLFVEPYNNAYSLGWSAPSLGDVVNIRWHNGHVHDAAGMPSGGAFYAGVQWNSEELKPYEKLSISEVELYIYQVPDALFLLIYEGDNLIAQQYVPNLKQYSFNTIELEQPLLINTNKTLRVVAYIEHNEISVPLGYDAGPGKVGRGDLYSSDGRNWSTLNANDIDGNWNITIGLRAYADKGMGKAPSKVNEVQFAPITNTTNEPIRGIRLAEEATSERNVLEGYNVYCNSELLNDEPLQETFFIDEEQHPANFYEYQVKALYSGCGEVGSNVVRVKALSSVETTLANGVRIYTYDGRVYIKGLDKGTKVTLVDAAGRVIHTGTSVDEPEYVINATLLPQGVYFVQVCNESYKVVIAQ